MREEQQQRAAEEKAPVPPGDSDDEGIDGGPGAGAGPGGMGDFLNIMKDPEVMQAFQVCPEYKILKLF